MSINVLLAIGLFAALAYWPQTHTPNARAKAAIKTLPLVMFATVALVSNAPLWLAVGLGLSAVGDYALARDGERAFLAGLVAFALAHVAYFAGFLGATDSLHLWLFPVLFGFGALMTIFVLPKSGALTWPARLYALIISAMCLAAFSLPAPWALATWGALLFLASDVLLAVQLFRFEEGGRAAFWAGKLLWPLYVAGQMLILFAFLPVNVV